MDDRPDTTLPDFDLDAFLPYRLNVTAERLSTELARLYRSQFGISIAEWRVLAHLLHSGEVSVRDIERRVNLEKSKVSRAAARLEAEGYITKSENPGDRRLVSLALTNRGRTLMAGLLPLAVEFQARLERLLGDRLDGLSAALDILGSGPTPAGRSGG